MTASRLLWAALIALTLCTGVWCAPIADAETPQALIDEINDLLDAAEHEGTAAILVEQREPAREIFSLWADRSMIPASSEPCLTGALVSGGPLQAHPGLQTRGFLSPSARPPLEMVGGTG